MRKRISRLSIIFLLLCGIIVGGMMISKQSHQVQDDWLQEYPKETTEEKIFEDVFQNDKASEAILFLTQRELMAADEQGYFHPQTIMTVNDFYELVRKTVLPRISELEEKEEYTEEQLAQPMTRGEAGILLAKIDLTIRGTSQRITSVSWKEQETYSEVEKTLLTHAIASGYLSNDALHQPLNRAEAAMLLYRFLNQ